VPLRKRPLGENIPIRQENDIPETGAEPVELAKSRFIGAKAGC
jgi:hypothetical protein